MKKKETKKVAAMEVKAKSQTVALPEEVTPSKVVAARTSLDVATSALVAAPWNPRGEIKPESVSDLTASIATVGIIEPVIARRGAKAGEYIIVAGHRRVAAAKAAGLASVPCDILDIDEATARRMMFIENLQRKDADPLLESELIGNLIADGMTQEEIAAETGRGEKWVARRLNLSKLSPSWRKRIADGEKITTDCIEHIAAYPKAIQERLKKTRGYNCADGVLHWSDIRREFVNESCDLKEAIFDCSKCYKCAKNSGCAPSLFDFDGGKNPALGRCLDPACYKRKNAKHIADTIEAAKASCVTIVKENPTYSGKKISTTKTRTCNTLYTWEGYDKEQHILWSESPKAKSQFSTSAARDVYDEKIAAERKEKRERNKAIRALAAWCATEDNLAKLLDDWFSDDYTKCIDPFAPFIVQEAFRLIGQASYLLVGTDTGNEVCARSALFGNLAVPDGWTKDAAKAIIAGLDPSRNEGYPAAHNALIILRMLGNDALGALGAENVGAIIPKKDDIEETRNPKVKWLCEETTTTDLAAIDAGAEGAIDIAEG